jgi:hypothetical protein
MDKFYDSRQRQRIIRSPTTHSTRQQHKSWAEELPACQEKVFIHLIN